jgi:hypothetical protein
MDDINFHVDLKCMEPPRYCPTRLVFPSFDVIQDLPPMGLVDIPENPTIEPLEPQGPKLRAALEAITKAARENKP